MDLLNGDEPALVMVYSGACESMLPVWDAVCGGDHPVKLLRVHYDDVPKLRMLYGIHYLPSFVSNRGDRVRVGYQTHDALESMVQGVK